MRKPYSDILEAQNPKLNVIQRIKSYSGIGVLIAIGYMDVGTTFSSIGFNPQDQTIPVIKLIFFIAWFSVSNFFSLNAINGGISVPIPLTIPPLDAGCNKIVEDAIK